MRWLYNVLAVVILVLFAIYVWPTKYECLTIDQGRGVILVRTNRVNGETEQYDLDRGWCLPTYSIEQQKKYAEVFRERLDNLSDNKLKEFYEFMQELDSEHSDVFKEALSRRIDERYFRITSIIEEELGKREIRVNKDANNKIFEDLRETTPGGFEGD